MSSTTSHAPVLSRAERRRRCQISFLFDPDSVVRVLAGRPHLAGLVGDPHQEGERATALPEARKRPGSFSECCGNTHYEHLVELLDALDACTSTGFRQPELLRTRGRRPFVEGLAEVAAADRPGCPSHGAAARCHRPLVRSTADQLARALDMSDRR